MLSRRVWKEVGLAAAVAALLAVSPLTGNGLVQKVGLGLAGGCVLLAYRLYTSRGAAAAEATGEDGRRSAWRDIPPIVWVGLGLYALLVAPTAAWLYSRWTLSLWVNDHGIFIPFIAGYFTWSTLRADSQPQSEESSAWGFAWLAVGVLMIVLDSGIRSEYLAVFGLLITLPGLSLLLLGRRRTKALVVPMAITLLAVPLPNSFASELYLRIATAASVEPILHWVGIPAFREATVIALPRNTFVVSNACSGFATLYASLAVAIILACYARSKRRRLLLLLAAPPLALAANIARVFVLVVLTDLLGGWVIESPLHPASGVATFMVVLVALFGIAGRGTLQPRVA